MHVPLAVIIIIGIALIFEFVNGFHDTANAVATSISTKSLEPHQAISIAAICNLLGALSGTAVAMTIAEGLASPHLATHTVLVSALLAAISWNLITWYFGLPSSSSHALIGGLVGAIICQASFVDVNYHTVIDKVILPMVASPILGGAIAFSLVIIIHRMLNNNTSPRKTNNFIREIQVLSTGFLSFSHGTNDAQKTMGIITLTLFNGHLLKTPHVPTWVIFVCAFCMALGTFSGGVRIIRTLSTRVAKLKPVNGLSAEISTGLILFVGSRFGMPLSTTHAVSGAIMGAGQRGINWVVVRRMVTSWVCTLPVCAIIGALFVAIARVI